MTNSDDDKRTKQSSATEENSDIAQSASRSDEQSDKTRIAVKRRTEQPETTRIANKKVDYEPAKTRVAPRVRNKTALDTDSRNKLSETPSDKTRVAPSRPQKNPDATQFKPNTSRPRKTSKPAELGQQSSVARPNKGASEGNLLKERFILEKVLGAGGMGVVYKAKDLVKVEAGDKDPYLAVKVLGDEFKQHPEAFIALQRESRKTQRIAHPNIVNVHDFDRDGDTVFMTMEYLEGAPLDELIRQYKSTGLPTEEAGDIIKSICRALIYAHKQDIIHSDFKPGNIFVTDKGDSKVFDFGIARAVAKVEHYDENLEDKTIFDAGDLGALTPAYASYEMLDGKEPDVRDDIYALGCVTYELLTGSHPFNKVPADEAKRQKLKPKRINHISRRQWKVIEKALAFEREDRIETVKEFLFQYSRKRTSYVLPIFIAVFILVSGGIYLKYFNDSGSGLSETEIRSELEFTLRFENYRNRIDEMLISKSFTKPWEADMWKQVQGVRVLLKNSEKWLNSTVNKDFEVFLQSNTAWYHVTEQVIYQSYVVQIKQKMSEAKFAETQELIDNASRYSENLELVEQQQILLSEAIAAAKLVAEQEAKKQQLAKEAAAQKLREQAKPSDNKGNVVKKSPKQQREDQFNVALGNVQTQLKCQSNKINTRNLETAVKKLRSINQSRYKREEKAIVSLLVRCITSIGKPFPERATEYKKDALKLFARNRDIAGIAIIPRDPCLRSLAGLGARGKRATCKDSIANLDSGPVLVVIPATKGIPAFAIGKYELSIAEFNLFCKDSKSCAEVKTANENLPISNLTIQQAERYLKWLSLKSKQKYRLPSKKEWLYAASAKTKKLDPNRNCQVNTRGISKGDKLVRISVGGQNSWGLVNYVGNASEWVYAKGRKLQVAGGGYNIPLEKCDINTSIAHTGKADEVTGFRVLREVK